MADNWFKKHKVWSVIIVLVVIGIIGNLFGLGDDEVIEQENQEDNTQNNIETEEDTTSTTVRMGEEGLLHQEDNSEVGICWTKESFDAMIDASVANDQIGWMQLFYDGDCSLMPSDTKVLVLENTFGASKFRILEGDYYGDTAWTNYEFIVPV